MGEGEVLEISDDDYSDDIPKDEGLNFNPPLEITCSRPAVDVGCSSSSSLRSSFIGMGFAPSVVDKAIEENEISNDDYSDDIPKDEGLNFNPPLEVTCSRPAVDVGCSSSSSLRSSFIGMGFTPSVVDKAIEENGEENSDLLLEALFALSGPAEDSFDYDISSSSSDNLSTNHNVKEEHDVDAVSSVNDRKMASLLEMNFSLAEIELAMDRVDRLGKDVPIDQLMDFIFAVRVAKKYENDGSNIYRGDKDCSDETVFGIKEKTLQLFEMGFTENEISKAFEICGSEASPQELAESIFYPDAHKSRPLKRKPSDSLPKAQSTNEPQFREPEFAEDTSNHVGRTRPKARKGNSSSGSRMSAWEKMVEEIGSLDEKPIVPSIPNNPKSRTLSGRVAKPPYFFYGNATTLSDASWFSITQFLYSVHPEFANTEMYSALSRTEGYVHNLPIEDRFHASPGGPCLPEQQRELIQQFQAKNLVWAGHNELGPLEPEVIEVMMGYPLHHTRVAGLGVPERLKSLKLALQTDALAYHISGLKKLFPEGLTMMSCFDGIGGVQVALHRLEIRLKGLVCVEANEMKREIVKKWWEKSGQSGELVQIDSIHKLRGSTLEELIKRFRGFDLIVCQHPHCNEESGTMSGLDFSMFAEFVRVLQRVRSSR